MKRLMIVLTLFMFLVLGACQAGYDRGYDDDYDYNTPAPSDPDADRPDAPPSGGEPIDFDMQPAVINRKIIYRANIGIVATDMHTIYQSLMGELLTYNAYVEAEEIRNDRIHVTLRVKSENLDDLLNLIRQGGEVLHYQKTSEDVTNQYSTFEARLNALNAQHDRIIELIQAAETMSDLLELENRRTQIESELNEIGLRLAQFDSLIDYSTIQLTITEIDDLSLLLPRSERPGAMVLDKTTRMIELRISNFTEDASNVTVKVYQDGIQIDQLSFLLQANSFQIRTIDNLNPDTPYYIEVRGIQENKSLSNPTTMHITTEPTFLIRVSNVFVTSISALIAFFQFLGLVIVAVLPFALAFAIIGTPLYIIYYKTLRPKRMANRMAVKAQIEAAKKQQNT